MVAAVFLGLSYAYRGGGLIRVTFLVDRLPGRLKLFADYVAHAVSLGFCVFVLLATTQQAIRALSDDTTLSALPIRSGPPTGSCRSASSRSPCWCCGHAPGPHRPFLSAGKRRADT